MQAVWLALLATVAVLAVGAGARSMIERLGVDWRTRRLRPTAYRPLGSQQRRRLLLAGATLLAMLAAGAAVAVVAGGRLFARSSPASQAALPRAQSTRLRAKAPIVPYRPSDADVPARPPRVHHHAGAGTRVARHRAGQARRRPVSTPLVSAPVGSSSTPTSTTPSSVVGISSPPPPPSDSPPPPLPAGPPTVPSSQPPPSGAPAHPRGGSSGGSTPGPTTTSSGGAPVVPGHSTTANDPAPQR